MYSGMHFGLEVKGLIKKGGILQLKFGGVGITVNTYLWAQ